ncbi:hypothetical protein TNCV_4013791 [Trichonephila clavipes]|nr:hypothetical protein TNCV_4013791 [Trichonephila clavipes]
MSGNTCLSKAYPQSEAILKLKNQLSGTTTDEGQELLCPSQYRIPLGTEVHEQMSLFGGLSEERPSVLKTPSKLGTHFSTQCSGVERSVNRTQDLWCGRTIHYHSTLFGEK